MPSTFLYNAKCKNIAAIAGAEDASSGKSPNTSRFKFPDVYIAAYNQRVWWIDQRKKTTKGIEK